MAIGNKVVWEVRAAGTELQGGGFDATAAGTDYSQQDGKRVAGDVTNISTTDAVMTQASTTVQSSTGNFTSTIVGNIICFSGGSRSSSIDVSDVVATGNNIITSATALWGSSLPVVGSNIKLSGGTGSLPAQWYKVVSWTSLSSITLDRNVPAGTGITTFHANWHQVSSVTDSSHIVIDRAPGLAGTGMTMNIGGANSNPQIPAFCATTTNVIMVKGDSVYQTAFGFLFPTTTTASLTAAPFRISGYGTTRGDGGKAMFQLTGSTASLTCLYTSGTAVLIENIIADCGNLATSTGIKINTGEVMNCKAMNFTTYGIYVTGNGGSIFRNEVTGGSGLNSMGINAQTNYCNVTQNYVHDNAFTGGAHCIMMGGSSACCTKNIVCNNSGSTTNGITFNVASYLFALNISENLCYNNGQDGIGSLGTACVLGYVRRNICGGNGRYGINFAYSNGNRAVARWDGNAFFSNGTANINYGDDGTDGIPANAVCKQNASGPYIRYLDIALGGSPFVNAAAGDFRLNNTYGNFIKGKAPPLSWPGLSDNRPYQDMGPIQHQDAGFAG